ncbi:MAG: hypothetical protein J7513_12370 [Solirubrobacteraceae bacterium]|nr:hypothetical protein [Solirubrobacteraceae bacterium]
MLGFLFDLLRIGISNPVDDVLPDLTDVPAGRTRGLTKTQGTGYFPKKPSRGYFGTGTGTARSPHSSIEAVGYAAGVPPMGARPAPPAPAPAAGPNSAPELHGAAPAAAPQPSSATPAPQRLGRSYPAYPSPTPRPNPATPPSAATPPAGPPPATPLGAEPVEPFPGAWSYPPAAPPERPGSVPPPGS